jgi:hypothetical protein
MKMWFNKNKKILSFSGHEISWRFAGLFHRVVVVCLLACLFLAFFFFIRKMRSALLCCPRVRLPLLRSLSHSRVVLNVPEKKTDDEEKALVQKPTSNIAAVWNRVKRPLGIAAGTVGLVLGKTKWILVTLKLAKCTVFFFLPFFSISHIPISFDVDFSDPVCGRLFFCVLGSFCDRFGGAAAHSRVRSRIDDEKIRDTVFPDDFHSLSWSSRRTSGEGEFCCYFVSVSFFFSLLRS